MKNLILEIAKLIIGGSVFLLLFIVGVIYTFLKHLVKFDYSLSKQLSPVVRSVLLLFTEAGIGYQMELGGCLEPAQAMIGNTGMILELDSLKLDLSKKTNIPEADADGRTNDFVGAYVRTVGVTLPSRWFNDYQEGTLASTLKLSGYDLLVGTGGLSGTIMLEAVLGTIIGGSNYYDNEFDLKYPVTLLQKNATTSIVEEIPPLPRESFRVALFPHHQS